MPNDRYTRPHKAGYVISMVGGHWRIVIQWKLITKYRKAALLSTINLCYQSYSIPENHSRGHVNEKPIINNWSRKDKSDLSDVKIRSKTFITISWCRSCGRLLNYSAFPAQKIKAFPLSISGWTRTVENRHRKTVLYLRNHARKGRSIQTFWNHCILRSELFFNRKSGKRAKLLHLRLSLTRNRLQVLLELFNVNDLVHKLWK